MKNHCLFYMVFAHNLTVQIPDRSHVLVLKGYTKQHGRPSPCPRLDSRPVRALTSQTHARGRARSAAEGLASKTLQLDPEPLPVDRTLYEGLRAEDGTRPAAGDGCLADCLAWTCMASSASKCFYSP